MFWEWAGGSQCSGELILELRIRALRPPGKPWELPGVHADGQAAMTMSPVWPRGQRRPERQERVCAERGV